MKKEEKEHILEEISAIQDRLQTLTRQLDKAADETTTTEDADEIREEEIPVVYIDTIGKPDQQQEPPKDE